MFAEASTELRAVATDFFFVGCQLEVSTDVFGTYQGASTIMRSAFDLKRSIVSMLDVDALPQSWMPLVQIYLRMVL
jgi:hypothetical protein